MRATVLLSVICTFMVGPGLFLGAALGSQGDAVEFPYLLKIAPGNALFVHGHEFRDSVTFEWHPGDSLLIEGMAVLPLPPVQQRTFPDSQLVETFGKVPFVLEQVAGGATWREATSEYERGMSEIVSDLRDSFRVALDSTGSEEQARDYVLASMDRSLFDPGKEPRIIGKTTIRVYWAGLPYSMRLDLGGRLSTEALPKLVPTRERAVGFTLHIARPLDGSWGVPWVVAIDRDGEMIVSGDSARDALLQVQRARQGEFVKGPFGGSEIKEILQVKGSE